MVMIRWKWVGDLNLELYQHNVRPLRPSPAAQVLYDSDKELFFERMNYESLRRFLEAEDQIQRAALQGILYTTVLLQHIPDNLPTTDTHTNDSQVNPETEEGTNTSNHDNRPSDDHT